jgi:hypothetical protein
MNDNWDEQMKRALLRAYAHTIALLACEEDVEENEPAKGGEVALFAQAWIRRLGRVFKDAD